MGIKNLVPKPVLTMGSLHQSELPTLAASKGDGSGAPSSHQHHNVGAQEAGPCSTVIHATVPPQGKRQRKIKCPLGLEQLLELKQRGEWMAYVSAHVGGPDRGGQGSWAHRAEPPLRPGQRAALGGEAGQPEQQRRASELGGWRQDRGGMFPGRSWNWGGGGDWQEMKRQVGKLCLGGFLLPSHLHEQELSPCVMGNGHWHFGNEPLFSLTR